MYVCLYNRHTKIINSLIVLAGNIQKDIGIYIGLRLRITEILTKGRFPHTYRPKSIIIFIYS